MRLFCRYTEEQHTEITTSADGMSKGSYRTPVADVQALVDSGDAILYNTYEDLEAAITYQSNRRNNYPAIEEQLDQIYHEGIDAWKETIQAVKDAHPKP